MFDVTNTILQNKKHIHFIGIGGSGMFPIVQILKSKGFYITGSDNNESDIIASERKMGIPIYMGHSPENINGADLIVHSAAIMNDVNELVAARNSGVMTIERSQMLGLITEQYSNCICVSGTHGKTTTTSMITQIMLGAGLDPTAVIGGKLPAIDGYGRAGGSENMVCEACEFVDTFLKLSPDVAVILNIDEDHLDYFKTLDNIIKSFNKFAEKTSKAIIYNGDDINTEKAVKNIKKPKITFGFMDTNDYYPANIKRISGISTAFELMHCGIKLADIEINVPGRHNVLNAVAACAAAIYAGATPEQCAENINDFKGAHRRFELLGKVNGITIVDDYAHHPAELKVTLEAAKQMGYKKVWAVFQPFTYSRTYILLDDFAKVLAIADRVVMTEIMGSREKNTYNIYTKDLAEKINGAVWFNTFEEIADYVMRNAEEGDLVLTLGCGDIYKCAKMMLKK